MKMESRIFPIEELEIRQEDGAPAQIVGYAAVFNHRSENLGGFVEVIEPGAFRDTLRSNPDVRATVDHEGGMTTIGRVRNGTLSLAEDGHGLRVRITPPDTQAGRDSITLVRGKYLDQMSFKFRTKLDAWGKTENGTPLRTLREVDMHNGDVSLVTYPAYPQTSAEARDMAILLTKGDSKPEGAEGGQDGEETREEEPQVPPEQDLSQEREDLQRRFAEIAAKEEI